MPRALLAAALLALAGAPSSVAQPVDPAVTGRPAPGRVPPSDVARPPTGQPDARSRPAAGLSPASAVFLSVGATAAGMGLGGLIANGDGEAAAVLAGVALALGPSAGNVALGETRDALVGAGLRTAGLALAVGGVAAMVNDPSPSGAEQGALAGLTVAGTVAFVGGLGYDFVTAGRNAGRVTVSPALNAGAPVAVVRVGL